MDRSFLAFEILSGAQRHKKPKVNMVETIITSNYRNYKNQKYQ